MSTITSTPPFENGKAPARRRARYIVAGLSALAITIALFYAEENWRGKRAWAESKRRLENKGVVMDWPALIPPPVPDDQNIFKAPHIQAWFVKKRGELPRSNQFPTFSYAGITAAAPVAVAEIRLVLDGGAVPNPGEIVIHRGHPGAHGQAETVVESVLGPRLPSPRGSFQFVARPLNQIEPACVLLQMQIKPTNSLKTVQEICASADVRIDRSGTNRFRVWVDRPVPPAAFIAATQPWEADLDVIREALRRPYARMDGDYSRPFEVPIPNFVMLRTVAQALAERTQCFLLSGQPENALKELTLLHDLSRLVHGSPTGKPMTLVAAMIDVAITRLYADLVNQGLRLETWKVSELAALKAQLQEIQLVPLVRGAVLTELPAICQTANHRSFTKLFTDDDSAKLKSAIFSLMPRGWVYQNMAFYADVMDQAVVEPLLANQENLVPHKLDAGCQSIRACLSPSHPFRLLSAIAIPNFIKAFQVTARNQTLVNQTAIACALEQYRMAHGQYPETLDALVPQLFQKIPVDIIGGQAPLYRRTDGKFLLYSIGWSEKDHGGKVQADRIQGDWVWPMEE